MVLACHRIYLIETEYDAACGMAAWARAFVAHRKLRAVGLNNNGLSQLTELRTLNLEDNTLRFEVRHTERWPNLTELNINYSLLRSREASLLIQALKENKSIGLITGTALLEVFEELPGLRHVEIVDNKFTTDDVGYNWSKIPAPANLLVQIDCSIDNVGG